MSDDTKIEWTDVLCTFSGPRKCFRRLSMITFRDVFSSAHGAAAAESETRNAES